MNKVISKEAALDKIKDGQTLMIGGFAAVGTPASIIAGIVERKIGNLTIIANDTGFPDKGIGLLVVAKLVKKMHCSHIGTNPETIRQFNAGELEIEFNPQGTLAERMRAGGAGIAGFYTPTGVGTVIADGKETKDFNGKTYLLETALHAEVSIVKAHKADKFGNLVFRRTAKNFNPLIATAGDIVIAEVEEIVEIGDIDPDEVMLPGIYVDYIVKA
ncbi:CoA transferase subunit A [Papillibacter cinnamivorans]|uniref:Acetate CoA/acetoacetate CoA-transferase alpha subunit n=1 Tax=Papillibacter cinnamivorans DSM 12816 TaxID=1122930 RepID=A0A1W2AB38_9FIRM|nr:CoA transferase subunit A [Papillibacter cinnamivorans]SMC57803.1 acetate CoA/acetoacetate CoA-transferase alpha subunit [Papillibacter cinnamivorans DSM 12816]